MKTMFTLLIVGLFGVLISDVNAGPRRIRKAKVDTRWEKKADKNNDGHVGPKELKDAKEKAIEHLQEKAVVDTKWEEKVDKDNDGIVEKAELAKAWQHYQQNNADVDKEWEKKADTNGDGKISHAEFAKAHRHLRRFRAQNQNNTEETTQE